MKKTNISIFLNYGKSKNIFICVKRYIHYYLLKRKLKKIGNVITFKNQFHILTSSDKNLCNYFCFSTNDLSIVLGDTDTMRKNNELLFELRDMCENTFFLMNPSTCKSCVSLDRLIQNLKLSVVGTNKANIVQYKKNEVKKQNLNIYPTLVEDSIEEIEKLFNYNVDFKKKRFLALKLLGKDFPLIDKILTVYEIDKYMYLKQKQELIEYGYDIERLSKIYLSYYGQKCKESLE